MVFIFQRRWFPDENSGIWVAKVRACVNHFSSNISIVTEFVLNWRPWLGARPSKPPLSLSLSPPSRSSPLHGDAREIRVQRFLVSWLLLFFFSYCNWSASNCVDVSFFFLLLQFCVFCAGAKVHSWFHWRGCASAFSWEVEIPLLLVSFFVFWICYMFSLCWFLRVLCWGLILPPPVLIFQPHF